MPGTHQPTAVEIDRFVHWMVHLMARRDLLAFHESHMASDCWEGSMPAWAQALADEEADPGLWCPALDPALRDVPDAPEEEPEDAGGVPDDLEARRARRPGAQP